MEINIPDQTVCLKNAEGEVILEASLLDIAAFLGFHWNDTADLNMEGDRISADQYITRIKSVVEPFNKEFGCNLTWGQINVLLNNLEGQLSSLKKN